VIVLALPLLILLQAMPPPLGQMVIALWIGRAFGATEMIVAVPGPVLPPPEDCNCGVPASPGGPR